MQFCGTLICFLNAQSLYMKLNQVAPVKSSAMSCKQRKTSKEKTNNVHVTNPNKIAEMSCKT